MALIRWSVVVLFVGAFEWFILIPLAPLAAVPLLFALAGEELAACCVLEFAEDDEAALVVPVWLEFAANIMLCCD